MSMPIHTITSIALALDPADRLRLAAELVDSVEEPEDLEWSAAWLAEIRARRERGMADAVPWADLFLVSLVQDGTTSAYRMELPPKEAR